MSRKHYLEVPFATDVTLDTNYKVCLPHAGRAGDPTHYRNGTGVPITCSYGWVTCDVDDPAQELFEVEFTINAAVHEVVFIDMITGQGFEQGRPFNFIVPLVLQDGDELSVRCRYTDAGSGNENQIVMIFQWEGDLP